MNSYICTSVQYT